MEVFSEFSFNLSGCFACVGWLHYGHDALVNNTQYVYNNEHAMQQRTMVPNHELNRYEEVKSCFGGVMVYRNEDDRFLDQQCRYTLTRDVFFTEYNNTEQQQDDNGTMTEGEGSGSVEHDGSAESENVDGISMAIESVEERERPQFNYSYDWWLNERWHNEYSEQSKLEMKLFVKQYIELLQVFEVTVKNKELIPKDGDICEHIPFHYCLWDKGFKFAISTRAKLYYDQFYPIDRNDTNWAKYFETRPKFTQ